MFSRYGGQFDASYIRLLGQCSVLDNKTKGTLVYIADYGFKISQSILDLALLFML